MIAVPSQHFNLSGWPSFALYERLCRETGQRHDTCVIDVFMSITHFLNGEPPLPWWEFMAKRKSAGTTAQQKRPRG